jgi:hypothetical protein
MTERCPVGVLPTPFYASAYVRSVVRPLTEWRYVHDYVAVTQPRPVHARAHTDADVHGPDRMDAIALGRLNRQTDTETVEPDPMVGLYVLANGAERSNASNSTDTYCDEASEELRNILPPQGADLDTAALPDPPGDAQTTNGTESAPIHDATRALSRYGAPRVHLLHAHDPDMPGCSRVRSRPARPVAADNSPRAIRGAETLLTLHSATGFLTSMDWCFPDYFDLQSITPVKAVSGNKRGRRVANQSIQLPWALRSRR